MGEKRPARRDFLKRSAALAGGFTLGAAAPAIGQTAPAQPPMIKGERDGEIGYGARSKYVTSARIPHGGRPSPDQGDADAALGRQDLGGLRRPDRRRQRVG
jgi:hypothetical protein